MLLPRSSRLSQNAAPTLQMLLRIPVYTSIRGRSAAAAAYTSPSSDDLWVAKALSTVFLHSKSPPLSRLTSFRGVLDPSIVFLAIQRLSDHPRIAVNLFKDALQSVGVEHCPATYRFLVVSLCRSGLHDDALMLFDEMLSRRLNVESSFLEFIVDSCANSGHLGGVTRLLLSSLELGCRIRHYSFNNVLSRLIVENRVDDAASLLEDHSSLRSFTPDTCSFNIVLKGLCRAELIDRAAKLFERMSNFACVPDTITYNTLIDGFCRANLIDEADQVLRMIQRDGSCSPNVVTFTSIISAYFKLGNTEMAVAAFNEMVSLGVKPSRVTYNVLIDGYGKVCNMHAAVSFYEKMVTTGCSPDIVTFTSLIDGYFRSGQFDDAMKLWHEIRKRNFLPNVYTFSTVINALCKMNRVNEARSILEELNGRKDIVPKAFIYNPVIDGLCKTGHVDEANLVLIDMEKKGCSPDKFTYTILVIGHCMKGRMMDAIAIFDRMWITGCKTDNIAFDAMISCLLKAGLPKEADEIMVKRSGKGS